MSIGGLRLSLFQHSTQGLGNRVRMTLETRHKTARPLVAEPGMGTRDPETGDDLALMVEDRHCRTARPEEILLETHGPALSPDLLKNPAELSRIRYGIGRHRLQSGSPEILGQETLGQEREHGSA